MILTGEIFPVLWVYLRFFDKILPIRDVSDSTVFPTTFSMEFIWFPDILLRLLFKLKSITELESDF